MVIGVRFGGSEETKSARAGGGGVAHPPQGRVTLAEKEQLASHRADLEREGYEFKLTAKQKAEEGKLRDAMDELGRSDDFTEDEKKDFSRDLQAKMMGIQPLPHRKEEVDFEKSMYTDPVSKKKYFMGGGRPFEIGAKEKDPVTPQMKYKMRQDARDEALDELTGEVDPNKAEAAYQRKIKEAYGGDGQQQQDDKEADGADGKGSGTMEMIQHGVDWGVKKLGMIWDPGPKEGEFSQVKSEVALDEKVPFDKPTMPGAKKPEATQTAKAGGSDPLLESAYGLAKQLEKGYKATDKRNSEEKDWEFPFTAGGVSQKLSLNKKNQAKEEYLKLAGYISEYEYSVQKGDFARKFKYKTLLDKLVKGYAPKSGSIAKAKK